MKSILSCLLCLWMSTCLAQYKNLGNQGGNALMTSDSTGYKVTYSQMGRGYNVSILKTTDDWNSTSLQNTFYSANGINYIAFDNDSSGVLSEADAWGSSVISRTKNGGTSWYGVSSSAYGQQTIDIEFLNDSIAFYIQNGWSMIVKLDSNIKKFTASSLLYIHNSLHFVSGIRGYALMESLTKKSYLVESLDKGNTWGQKALDTNERFTSVAFLDTLNGLMGTSKGLIFSSTDGGKNWANISTPTNQRINQIEFIGNNECLIVCDSGKAYISSDTGNTWLSEQTNVSFRLVDIFPINDEVVYLKGSGGEILRKSRLATSIQKNLNSEEINIYPIPAHDFLYLKSSQKISYSIYTVQGKKVLEGTGVEINVDSLSEGIYIISMQDEKGQLISQKFIKK